MWVRNYSYTFNCSPSTHSCSPFAASSFIYPYNFIFSSTSNALILNFAPSYLSPFLPSPMPFLLFSPSPLCPVRCLKQQQTWWVTVSSTLVATLCWLVFPPLKTLSRTRNLASSYSCFLLLLPLSRTHTQTHILTHSCTYIYTLTHKRILLPFT